MPGFGEKRRGFVGVTPYLGDVRVPRHGPEVWIAAKRPDTKGKAFQIVQRHGLILKYQHLVLKPGGANLRNGFGRQRRRQVHAPYRGPAGCLLAFYLHASDCSPRRTAAQSALPLQGPLPVHRLTSSATRLEAAALWRLAWPILIGQLATIGMSVADVAMAGHASAQDLASVSLGVSIWHIVIVTLMGVLIATNTIVAQHVGAGAFERIGPVVRQALWNAVLLGLLAMLVANGAALVFAQLQIEVAVQRGPSNPVNGKLCR